MNNQIKQIEDELAQLDTKPQSQPPLENDADPPLSPDERQGFLSFVEYQRKRGFKDTTTPTEYRSIFRMRQMLYEMSPR